MKKLNIVVLSIILTGLFFCQSCKKEETFDQESSDTELQNGLLKSDNLDYSDGTIALGKKLENPYSIENMQIAYDNLKQKRSDFKPEFQVKTSHLYVRFLPRDEKELDLLKQDTTLELFDYPLDYEIEKGGTYYYDPLLPKDQITWQYCAVKSEYHFPAIRYEILSELFIPEEIEEKTSDEKTIENIYDLVTEALIITDNLDAEDNSDSTKRYSLWNPSGTIKVWDDIKNQHIALRGAKVRARRWYTVKTNYTNSSGYFKTGQFRRKVNYSIKWERFKYDIRNGTWGQAYYNGPKKRGSWTLNISSGESLRYATIHRAAYRYHYRNIGGLKRPNVWSKLKYCYYHREPWFGNYSGMNWGNLDFTGVFPDIQIFGKVNGYWVNTNELFSTTIHETGHASHIALMNAGEIQFLQVSKIIYESWAEAIEWYITKIEYNELGVSNYDNPDIYINGDNKQWWNSSYSHDYTPLFIDLVDTYNQSLNKGVQPTNKCPNGGTFDGCHCHIGTPPSGESAFIYSDNFYYTPVGCCNCPLTGSEYDGANCKVMDIPVNSIGFIWHNKWYLHPAGNSNYPYDQVSGYTMHSIESFLKHVYGLSSLQSKLKANKPSRMTDKHLDIYLNYFFNL
ncbi:MAG: hypothetical protein KAT68_08550 [Bacteroidales bacterium]|nr:hypothetical protein [Bacteroidales bacterium]